MTEESPSDTVLIQFKKLEEHMTKEFMKDLVEILGEARGFNFLVIRDLPCGEAYVTSLIHCMKPSEVVQAYRTAIEKNPDMLKVIMMIRLMESMEDMDPEELGFGED